MAIKTFTTGEVLTASDTNTYLANSGLVYVSTTTIGSGVTSVPVANCFSSTYDNYRIIISGSSSNGTASHSIQLSGTSAGYYVSGHYFSWGSASATAYGPPVQTVWFVSVNNLASYGTQLVLDVLNPYVSSRTDGWVFSTSANGSANFQLLNSTVASSTGFTLAKSGDTMTGGTITVYGYRKA